MCKLGEQEDGMKRRQPGLTKTYMALRLSLIHIWAVSAAEECSERRVEEAKNVLLALNGVFMVLAGLLAWLGAIQSRRQLELQKAEDENRRKSENLARMALELQAPMDEISELMYISDTENYELLFLNEAGRKLFGVTELKGQKLSLIHI